MKGIDITISSISSRHINQVYEIEKSSFAVPWSLESFQDDFKNHHTIYFGAFIGQRLVGFIGMHHILDEGHITNIAVLPCHRRMGIGDALLISLINHAIASNITAITLEARMGNAPALKLYGKHGFVFEGIRKNYYTDTKEDAVIMWKYIKSGG